MSDVKVILDVEIGHGICPEDETEETCKLNKVSEAIQQELLKARIDQIVKIRQLFDETVDISDFLIALHEQYKSLQAKLKGDE
jgi:hypothetical protein